MMLRGNTNETKYVRNENEMKSDYTESYEARTARIRNEVARRGSANEHSDEAAAAHGVDCTRHERITIVARRRGADEHPDEAAARTSGLHTTRTISRGDRSRATRECGRALRRSCSRTRARTAHDRTILTRKADCRWPGCHGGGTSASVRQSMHCRGWTPISAHLRPQNMHSCRTGLGSSRAASHMCEKRHSEPLRHAPRRQKLKQRGEPAASV